MTLRLTVTSEDGTTAVQRTTAIGVDILSMLPAGVAAALEACDETERPPVVRLTPDELHEARMRGAWKPIGRKRAVQARMDVGDVEAEQRAAMLADPTNRYLAQRVCERLESLAWRVPVDVTGDATAGEVLKALHAADAHYASAIDVIPEMRLQLDVLRAGYKLAARVLWARMMAAARERCGL